MKERERERERERNANIEHDSYVSLAKLFSFDAIESSNEESRILSTGVTVVCPVILIESSLIKLFYYIKK